MLQSAIIALAIASLATLLPNAAAFSPAGSAPGAAMLKVRTIPSLDHTTLSPDSSKWNLSVSAPHHGRSRTVLQSAKILPFAYTSLSAALFVRATKAATNKADAAVLAATAALALFNLGPTDNARLASAKRADKNTPPASSGKAKQLRQAAKTWRSVVRIKLIGQFVGLVWMATSANSVMKGAATVMAANMAFFLCGAGRAMHNANGEPAPMPASMATMILTIDTILTSSALMAASAPMESTKRAIFAGIYAVGVSIGALEGLANLVSFYLMKRSKAKETDFQI